MLSIGGARHRRADAEFDEYRLARRHDADGSATLQLVSSVIVPGAPMMRRAPLAAAVILTVGFVLPVLLAVTIVMKRDRIISIALDPNFLLTVAILGPLAVLVRFIAVAEVAEVFRGTRLITLKVTVATLVVTSMGVAAVWFAGVGLEARAAIAGVFGDGSETPVSEVALAPADTGDVFSPSDVAANTDPAEQSSGDEPRGNAAQSFASPDEVRTVLVMGVDSGPGRHGRRTDTMLLVTVHPASGRTALISVPRNLTRLQFPADTPLGDRYPSGFSDFANGVFTAVSDDPALTEAYGWTGFPAEPIALSSGIAHSLDVQIDDFVLIDMLGFADVIDAVGGVTVELCQVVSLPPSLPGEPAVSPEIGPGEIDMDGVTALAYARTRYADSDYERTGRQRQLLAALSSQISLVEALRAFTAVARVLDESLRTSLTVGEFDDLLQALGDNSSIVESVGLVPPLIEPGDPDYDQIRGIVADVHRAIVTGEPSGYTTDAGPEDPNDRTTDADGNCLT